MYFKCELHLNSKIDSTFFFFLPRDVFTLKKVTKHIIKLLVYCYIHWDTACPFPMWMVSVQCVCSLSGLSGSRCLHAGPQFVPPDRRKLERNPNNMTGVTFALAVLCHRHHGETSAVGRCLSELLRVPPGGQHVALAAASLHRLSGGHQHPPALFCPAVGAAGQPQHRPGGEAQRRVHPGSTWRSSLFVALNTKN